MDLSGEALIARLPKAELHMHIEGSIEPEMVLAFAERNGIDFPYKSIEALRATYEFDNLAGFGAVYRSNSQVLRTGRDFHDMTYAYMRRVRQDEVIHAEIAFAPQGASKRGVDPIEALEAVLDAMELAKADFGMTGRRDHRLSTQLGWRRRSRDAPDRQALSRPDHGARACQHGGRLPATPVRAHVRGSAANGLENNRPCRRGRAAGIHLGGSRHPEG